MKIEGVVLMVAFLFSMYEAFFLGVIKYVIYLVEWGLLVKKEFKFV